jgi:hypothetical protein
LAAEEKYRLTLFPFLASLRETAKIDDRLYDMIKEGFKKANRNEKEFLDLNIGERCMLLIDMFPAPGPDLQTLKKVFSNENIATFSVGGLTLLSTPVGNKASDLHTFDSLSMLCRPVYCSDYSFLNHYGVKNFLETKKSMNQETHKSSVKKIVAKLQSRLGFYPTYKYSTGSETELILPNLQNLLGILVDDLIHDDNPSVQKVTSEIMSNYSHVFATSRSVSEESVCLTKGNHKFYVCGSEAKGADAGPLRAMSQTVQIASDALFYLIRQLNCDHSKIVVPSILIAGEIIQFALVYSLPGFFPVPLFVSKELNYLRESEDLEEIARWLLTIAENTALIYAAVNEKVTLKTGEVGTVINCDTKSFFLKPVQVYQSSGNLPRLRYYSRMSHIVEIYSTLFQCPPVRPYIVFPIGFQAYPSHNLNHAEDIISVLDIAIPKKLWRTGLEPFNPEEKLQEKKWSRPIRIYPNIFLMNPPFQETVQDGKVILSTDLHDAFLGELSEAFSTLKAAKVCHFDLRLENIVYRVKEDSLEIKILDWDYSDFFGRELSADFREMVSNPYSGLEYPNFTEAGPEWYDHYFERIISKLKTK